MTNKLASLDFSTPNNACLSLRVIAEMVRQGQLLVDTSQNTDIGKRLRVDVYDVRERVVGG